MSATGLQVKLKQPPLISHEELGTDESLQQDSRPDDSPNLQYQIEETDGINLDESGEEEDFDQDPTLDELQEPDDNFNPSQSDYVIRQNQIANFQILSQFLAHEDKNVTETLKDIRVSIDGLSKCVLHLNNTIEKLVTATNKKSK
jgi:hypothetical protein